MNSSQSMNQLGHSRMSVYPMSPNGSSNLKTKLSTIEELIMSLRKELEYHNQRLKRIMEDKDKFETDEIAKHNNLRKKLLNDLQKLEEGISRSFVHQKAENSRLQAQVTDLKENHIVIDQRIVGLDRKINELEYTLGSANEIFDLQENESQA